MILRLEGVGKAFAPSAASAPGARGAAPSAAALTAVDLEVASGEVLGIIGRSGAGKSTLLRLLNGLERATAGRVWVGGQEVGQASAPELIALRRRVGMVFQQFNLLSAKTVAQNVALPLLTAGVPHPEIGRRLADVLERVGLQGRENAYPSQLSGGQKQRVGIARALISRPEILLCDEATSALDPETSVAILELLAGINRDLGVTLVLVTHEMEVIRRICARVVVLEAGRIVEDGPVWQVFGAPQSPAAQALLRPLRQELPAALLARLGPRRGAQDRAVVRLCFDGTGPAELPAGDWLVGALDQIAGHAVGQAVLLLPPGIVPSAGMEVLGHVATDD